MSIKLDKLLSGFRKKQKPPVEKKPEVDAELVSKYTERMKGVVYDDELASTFGEIFASLNGTKEVSEEILELLEMKERQIQAIAEGGVFEQESGKDGEKVIDQESDDDEDPEAYSVENLIKQRGNKQ